MNNNDSGAALTVEQLSQEELVKLLDAVEHGLASAYPDKIAIALRIALAALSAERAGEPVAWCIRGPTGELLIGTLAIEERDAWLNFCLSDAKWAIEENKAKGYRAVQVTVSETDQWESGTSADVAGGQAGKSGVAGNSGDRPTARQRHPDSVATTRPTPTRTEQNAAQEGAMGDPIRWAIVFLLSGLWAGYLAHSGVAGDANLFGYLLATSLITISACIALLGGKDD